MLPKISIFITLLSVFTFISFSQKPADEYQPPKVIEGSNLTVFAYPDVYLTKMHEQNSRFISYLQVSSGFNKWRYTEKLDYAFSTGIGAGFAKNSYFSDIDIFSNGRFHFNGGASYYFLKDKLFAGGYTALSTEFDNHRRPYFNVDLYPNIGYGKITDAFIVNETSNFEKTLTDEDYISRPFDKKTRVILNSILDKRNGNTFSSLFKEDAEIEFFTELEKYLLDEKIISKPLNARVTMKLYQTLSNANFILLPLYKGYQFQAEMDYRSSNYNDTVNYPLTLSLNAAYGLPLSIKTSILFSAHYIFPFNSNYNTDYSGANMHSPVFIRSEHMNISNYSLLNKRYINLFEGLYDYKASFDFYVFHYLNRMAGVTGRIEFNTGKQKTPESKIDYSVNAEADLVFNIINKLRVTTGIEYLYTSRNEYNFSLGGGISYIFF